MKQKSRRNEPSWKTEQFRHLKRLNQQGRLALFIGAGISHGCGLPGWDVLVRTLAIDAYRGKIGQAFASVGFGGSISLGETAKRGTPLAKIAVSWSNGAPFTGKVTVNPKSRWDLSGGWHGGATGP